MKPSDHPASGLSQRPIAALLALICLIAGMAPTLHDHRAEVAVDPHCHDSGPIASPHLETQEPTHHEACGLCVKLLSFDGLERPSTTLTVASVAKRASESSYVLPPGPPGRHGASRAPPLA